MRHTPIGPPSICPIYHGCSWTDYPPKNSCERCPTTWLYTFLLWGRFKLSNKHCCGQWEAPQVFLWEKSAAWVKKMRPSGNLVKERHTTLCQGVKWVLKPVSQIKMILASWDVSDSPRKWSVLVLLQLSSPWYHLIWLHVVPQFVLVNLQLKGQFVKVVRKQEK